MTKPAAISPLAADDYAQWLPLWHANNLGPVDGAVTAQTWLRLTEAASPIRGLKALVGDRMAGFVHYVIHPVTGHLRDACYMQDLYVAPDFRRRGIARALVQALADLAKAERYARLYWLAEASSVPAQQLYADIGYKLDFTLHILPL